MVEFATADVVARLRRAGCVFAEEEARLLLSAARTPASLAALVEQRVGGRALEHVLGWAEFCGQRIAVEAGVFVPRRRTEFLVRQAAALGRSGCVVLDLCCGSGAVGAALAALDRVEVHAVDIDPAAVRCARRNVPAAVGRVYQGDLYDPLPATLRNRVDLLVVNAPYVPTQQVALLPREARISEPRRALDGGADGLAILGRVLSGAAGWLSADGSVLAETSEDQAPAVLDMLDRGGLVPRVASCPELNATVVIGIRPPARPGWSGRTALAAVRPTAIGPFGAPG